MLDEGDERCSDRGNLLRSHVHELHLVAGHDGEIGVETGLDAWILECAVVVDGSVALGDNLAFLNLGGKICYVVVVEVHTTVGDGAVRRLDETEIVDFAYTQSDEIRPMLGPSGVSIGQSRP